MRSSWSHRPDLLSPDYSRPRPALLLLSHQDSKLAACLSHPKLTECPWPSGSRQWSSCGTRFGAMLVTCPRRNGTGRFSLTGRRAHKVAKQDF